MSPSPNRSFRAPVAAALLMTLLDGCASEPTVPRAVDDYVAGATAYKRGQVDTAVKDLESAVAKNPDLRMARTLLGQIYRERNDYKDAVRQYEVLARLDPYTQQNQYFLGVCYQLLKDYAGAIRAYLASLKLNPLDYQTNMNLGTVMLATGDVDNAIKYLDKATQINPKSAIAWSNLGVAFDARGSAVFAETAYRKAVALESDAPAVLQNLANNLLLQQKSVEATYLWQQVVQHSPNDLTKTKLGEAYTLGGEVDKARAVLDGVLSVDAQYVPALTAKGNLLIRQYELSGYSDDKSRAAGVALLRRSLALNGQQQRAAEQLKKYATALPLN